MSAISCSSLALLFPSSRCPTSTVACLRSAGREETTRLTGSLCQVRQGPFPEACQGSRFCGTPESPPTNATAAGDQLLGAQVHLTLLDALRHTFGRGIINSSEVNSTELLNVVMAEVCHGTAPVAQPDRPSRLRPSGACLCGSLTFSQCLGSVDNGLRPPEPPSATSGGVSVCWACRRVDSEVQRQPALL